MKHVELSQRACPMNGRVDNPSLMILIVLSDAHAAKALAPVAKAAWGNESFALGKRFAYLWCPAGTLAGKLWTAVDRAVKDGGTGRNLATMTKLLALAGD